MKNLRWYLLLLLATFIGVAILFFQTSKTEQQLSLNLQRIVTDHTFFLGKNIEELLKQKLPSLHDLPHILKSNPKLRRELNQALSLLSTPTFPYVYLVYKDHRGHFRYLLDGSKEDRGDFNQKIDVSPRWNAVFQTKKPLVITHHKLQTLWITYLYPILFDNKVQGIVAIDFSSHFLKLLHSALKPLKYLSAFIFAIVSFLLLVVIFQILIYLKTKKESVTDSLTGLYNRTFLRHFLDDRNIEDYYVFMFDIDHFKSINDTYGHKVGDYVLQTVANLLKQNLRGEDIIVRYGGEEFLGFIKKSSPKNAIAIAERIRKAVENYRFKINDHEFTTTLSVGINLHPERFKKSANALKYADELLYMAKRSGRNKVVYQKESATTSLQTLPTIKIKELIEDGGLFCQFQPIFDIQTQKIVKYEALVRLKEKTTIYYPNQFVPNIQFTTLYTLLTQNVLRIVLDKIKQTNKDISINLSFFDITDNKIYYNLLSTLTQQKELASKLTIELLETEALDHKELIAQRLHELKDMGVHTAIDNFGSGYSNFTIFQELPIDILKIDGKLVKMISHDPIAHSIVTAITQFGNNIGVETIAKFVENEEILHSLKKMGIRYAQGFYFSKPTDL